MVWLYVILAGIASGVLSLFLGLIFTKVAKYKHISSFIIAFAAGSLLATAFFDLLHEAIEIGLEDNIYGNNTIFIIMIFALGGILLFYVLETLMSHFHSHACENPCDEKCCHSKIEHNHINIMIMIGDTLHNFVDGIAIAAAFLISPLSGLIVTLVIMLHEIPQEISDIAIMNANGIGMKKVILLNLYSSLASLLGAIIFYSIGVYANVSNGVIVAILALIAGFFIYIASTDIIPTLHNEKNKKIKIYKMLSLLFGVIILGIIIYFCHPLIG